MARGRPTKFKKDMIKDAELLAGIGLTEKDLATYWGVSKRTFEYWKRHNEGELLHALLKGRLSANITVTKQLYNQATQGNVTAIIFWLINRCSEYWKDRKAMINQVIGSGGDVNIETRTKNAEIRQMVSSWTPEEKKRFVSVVTSLNKEFKTKRIGELIKVEDEQGENEEVKAGQEANQDVEKVSEEGQAPGSGEVNDQGAGGRGTGT